MMTQTKEELMDLVLKLNNQLKETKKELDNLIQSKKSDLAIAPQTVIPTVSTVVPSTLAATLAPTIRLATTLLVTSTTAGTSTSTNTETPTEKTTQLIKAMEEMSMQAIEHKKLSEKVSNLETNCKLVQT